MKRFHPKYRHRFISFIKDMNVVGIRLLAQQLPRLLFFKPRQELILRTLHGFDLVIDPARDTGVERSLYHTGTYEKGTLHIMGKLLAPGDTFIDVGANIGLMSVFAAGLVGDEGRVLAFEPNPATRRILERNVALNGMRNIEVSPFATGSRNQASRIFDSPDLNRGRATMMAPVSADGGYEVKVTRLSDLVGEEEVKLVKLDVEGYELEALKGMGSMFARSVPPILIIEHSAEREERSGTGANAVYDHLSGLGRYRIFKAAKTKERVSRLIEVKDRRGLPAHDNIFCFTPEHMTALQDAGAFR